MTSTTNRFRVTYSGGKTEEFISGAQTAEEQANATFGFSPETAKEYGCSIELLGPAEDFESQIRHDMEAELLADGQDPALVAPTASVDAPRVLLPADEQTDAPKEEVVNTPVPDRNTPNNDPEHKKIPDGPPPTGVQSDDEERTITATEMRPYGKVLPEPEKDADKATPKTTKKRVV